MEVPEVQYARSGDAHIAYQVFGEGPDLVFTPSGFNHLLIRWELPANVRLLRRLASFSRVVLWDKRGTGLSDRHGPVPTIEEQLDDLAAIIEASGSQRPALFGFADGAFLTAMFAARRPERVASMILYGFGPRFAPGEDGLGVSREFVTAMRNGDLDTVFELSFPSLVDDRALRAWWRRYTASAASPGTMQGLVRGWLETDITDALRAIRVPTTIVQRLGDRICPPPNSRVAADLVEGARYAEVEGDFSAISGPMDGLLGEIEERVTGARHGVDPDRVLATILFTDIVGSTAAAAELGDTVWRERLDEHDTLVSQRVDQLGGRVVKRLGDGVLATFDSTVAAIRCAEELMRGLGSLGIPIRAGVHTGECERRGDDIGGIAVHIAARVAALAAAHEVLVTGTVRDVLVGSGLTFDDRGEHELRGVPGSWRVLALTS